MIKKEHFSLNNNGGYSFNSLFYLLDYNPGLAIDFKRINTIKLTLNELLDLFKDLNLKQINCTTYENNLNNLLVDIHQEEIDDELFVFSLFLSYSSNFDIENFNSTILPKIEKIKEKKGFKMNLITMSNGNPNSTTVYSNKLITIDKNNSYNLSTPLDVVIEDIKSDKSGLIIFESKPGAGKSSLLKYLAQELKDKRFYFLNNNNINILSNPEFTTYCLAHLKDSVLILEDCEKALTSRDKNKGFDISNILNITDGIIGDLLNLKIIATLNTTDKLDTALLRKGRLIRQVTFKPLQKEQVINLSKSLNIEIDEPNEMMLCDVYNYKESGSEVKQTTKIGF